MSIAEHLSLLVLMLFPWVCVASKTFLIANICLAAALDADGVSCPYVAPSPHISWMYHALVKVSFPCFAMLGTLADLWTHTTMREVAAAPAKQTSGTTDCNTNHNAKGGLVALPRPNYSTYSMLQFRQIH